MIKVTIIGAGSLGFTRRLVMDILAVPELRDTRFHFGYYSTESNGHLSEYLPWYRKRPHEIEQWISRDSWMGGETGGYLCICRELADEYKRLYPKYMSGEADLIKLGERSSEHGSYIIESLETGRLYRGHFNVGNTGLISNCRRGARSSCHATSMAMASARPGWANCRWRVRRPAG